MTSQLIKTRARVGAIALALALVLTVSLAPRAMAAFSVTSFDGEVLNEDGTAATQAGGHPYSASTTIKFSTAEDPTWGPMPDGSVKDVIVDLPPGFLGNPLGIPRCTDEQFGRLSDEEPPCPIGSQIGVAELDLGGVYAFFGGKAPIYNMVPSPGTPAVFKFEIAKNFVTLKAIVRPDDHGVSIGSIRSSQALPVNGVTIRLWGVPAEKSHDIERGNCLIFGYEPNPGSGECESHEPRVPLISTPTRCTAPGVGLRTDVRATSWDGGSDSAFFVSHLPAPDENIQVGTTGCNQLEFEPTVQVRPTTNLADAPTGLEFDLHIPQNEEPDDLATAHLRDAVVTLPEGMTVNPPSADGLDACSMAEVGISPQGVANGEPASCPAASKIGTVEGVSPAIDHPIKGSVFLAEQNANPFDSMIAIYLVLDDQQTGVRVKLAGRVDSDPQTGQLTTTFRDNPQLPVEDLRLRFKQGPRAPLKTPAACGVHTTATTLVPWSAPEGASAFPASSFELTRGPSGGSCEGSGGSAPNTRNFEAGTVEPRAKAFSPFLFRITRPDASQPIKAIDATLPKGLLASLAGVPYCSDAALVAAAGKRGNEEKSSPSCPAASRVGTVNVGAGAGSTPLHVSGAAYLAGPYKGAPLSMAIVTPAVAGPFDLGTVVVRTALRVDPKTAQVKALSDPIPTILEGIPLNVRSIDLRMDRPSFTLNPTSCAPMSVGASVLSVFDQAAELSSPFQVGGCADLGFKPKLELRLKGGTKRSDYPALTATLRARPGDANIGSASVAMPRTQFLAQNHIRTTCTRVQFAADACPQGSVYGQATAWTPLLDQPLSGPVYLRSNGGERLLPDLVADLRGQIRVELEGHIDSHKAGIRTTFAAVPDAPVSKFVLKMQGGKKGLLENSRNLCLGAGRATVRMSGQNGAQLNSRTALKVRCKGKKGGKRKGGAKRGGKKKRG